MKLEFSRQILEKISDVKLRQSPMETEFSHADEKRTDKTKLTVVFGNFAKAPTKKRASLPSAAFETAIPAIERPQAYSLNPMVILPVILIKNTSEKQILRLAV
jgi:hypothetical protein